MIRVLQLVEAGGSFEAARGSAQLVEGLGTGFSCQIRTVGRGGQWPGTLRAVRELRRLNDIDLVHAWGPSALTVAALGTRARIAYSPDADLSSKAARWARAITGHRDVHTFAPTATLRRALVQAGLPLDRCHLIRPGVNFAAVRSRKNPALRAALGLVPDDIVLLAVGESTPSAAHHDLVWASGILHTLDPRFKLLLWGRGKSVADVLRFNHRVGTPDLLRVAQARLTRPVAFEELLAAADIPVISARGAVATLPIAIAMASALPIVSTVTYTVSELLEDHHTALMAPKARPRVLAQRILSLKEDKDLQWRLADMARTEAYEYFTLTRFIEQWRVAYRQVASGQTVEVPEQAPGVGLRFHGRA